jgi:hypothetical protein
MMDKLDDEMIHAIAEKAAELAVEKVMNKLYEEVGRSILSKITWGIGIVFISAALWLAGNGHLGVKL